EYLAGITSSGDPKCSDRGRDARIDRHFESFIEPYLKETAPGAAGVGARCFYPEHCAVGRCVPAVDDSRLSFCLTECGPQASCPEPLQCIQQADGRSECRHPVPSPSARGAACMTDVDCLDGICARQAKMATGICTQRCFVGNTKTCSVGL